MEESTESRLNIPLSQVTLSTNTREAFDFINHDVFTKGLLEISNDEDIVLKQGSVFPSPDNSGVFQSYSSFHDSLFQDIFVLQCSPLYQGKLDRNTQMIVVDRTNVANTSPESGNKEIQQNISSKHSSRKPELPIMSDFLGIFRHIRRNQNLLPGQLMDIVIQENIDHPGMKATLRLALEYSDFEKLTKQYSSTKYDKSNMAVLSRKFAQNCGLFNGDFMVIKLQNNSTGKPNHGTGEHLCQVKIVDTVIEFPAAGDDMADSVYVLPSVIWALQADWTDALDKGVHVYIKRYVPLDFDSSGYSVSSGHRPPFAAEVHISCIQSPSYNAQDSYSDLLQTYFKTPRVVQQNSVLCLNSQDDPEFWQDITESSECRLPVVYFKVTQVKSKVTGCETYLADSNHTTLYLDGTVSSFIPSMMSHVIKGSHVTIPGVQCHVTRILELLTPYVKTRDKLPQIYPSVLLSGPPGSGKTSIVKTVATFLNMHCFQVNCHELCAETSGATEARIKHALTRANGFKPCVVMLRNLDALGKDRDGNDDDPRVIGTFQEQTANLPKDSGKYPTLLIATTSSCKTLSADMQECFLHHVEMGVPNELQRLEMLKSLFDKTDMKKDVNLKQIAQRTAGMVLGDLQALLCGVKRVAYNRIVQYCKKCLGRNVLSWSEEQHIANIGYAVCQDDIEQALGAMQAAHSDSLGAPKIPNIQWSDVGGLISVKSEILDTIQLPLQHPELFAQGLRRSGVLLYGPPGTGKTLLAKAVATECSLNFLSVKGPELINMYVGQSEENIREVFHRARSASPCVIFFDELDSLAPNRGRSGDSGGVMDRIVSQLLAELDGLHKAADVFVIGATNRPDLLDPALLRPGRFDKLLYLGVSEDRDSQLNIIKALTRKFHLSPDCSLETVVSQCPYNMTGADFYALCSDAMLNALKESIEKLELGEEVDQTHIVVCEGHFLSALDNLVPSVSVDELQHYKMIQQSLEDQRQSGYVS